MTLKETLNELKSLRNETMFALNVKNGANSNQFGVKMGDIRSVAKKIKVDHQLGLELWKTENLDARLLAALIIKPKDLSGKELDDMVKSINHVQVADWFNANVLKDHPEGESLREKWIASENIWAARAGWSLTAGKVVRNSKGLDLNQILNRIELEMPASPPQVQWTMNTTLGQIGINFPELRDRAISIGEKLGIYRNYPVSKGCTSPFAPIWIKEMVSRQGQGR